MVRNIASPGVGFSSYMLGMQKCRSLISSRAAWTARCNNEDMISLAFGLVEVGWEAFMLTFGP